MSAASARPSASLERPRAETQPRVAAADVGLAALSAALLVLSFPKFDLSALAWVALVPLLLALDGKTPRQAFLLCHLTGVLVVAGIFYWIWTIPAFGLLDGLLIKVGYLPLYMSVWGLLLTWTRRWSGLPLALLAPPLWVTSEYIRAHAAFLSLPWMFLGHSQYAHPSLIQIAAVTGAYGVSFLIVFVNAALAELLVSATRRSAQAVESRRPRRAAVVSVLVGGLLLIGTAVYGRVQLGRDLHTERLPVAVIQGNIPQNRKWDESFRKTILDKYADLTRDAARSAPALVVWPESAVPGDVQHQPELRRKVAELAVETRTPLLVGSSEVAKFTDPALKGKRFNSLVLFSPRGAIEAVYRKLALVPFGEYVPLRDSITWPKAIVSEMGDYVSGDQHTPFTVGAVTFRSGICWEIIFPDLIRAAVSRGASFMVLATNEAWFGDTAAPYQLLAMTVFRAAENRIAIVRSANSGISAFIDPFGRITQRLTDSTGRDLFVEGILTGGVPLTTIRTLYTRYGDLFALLQATASAVFLALSAWIRSITKCIRSSDLPSAETAERRPTECFEEGSRAPSL